MPGPNQHHVPQNLMLAGLFAERRGCSTLHCDHVLTSSASLTAMDKFINNSKRIVPYATFWFGVFVLSKQNYGLNPLLCQTYLLSWEEHRSLAVGSSC